MAVTSNAAASSMAALLEYAKTLDTASTLTALAPRVPKVPRNVLGQIVTQQDWALSGLHLLRTDPANKSKFTADEIAASNTWLVANGWVAPT